MQAEVIFNQRDRHWASRWFPLPLVIAVALHLVVLVAPCPLFAGNDDAYLLGNEAAMTGGAVGAVTRSAGAV